MYDYTDPLFPNLKTIVVYNPHPYPVIVTEKGHFLGGREKAVVPFIDRVAGTAIDKGFLMKIEEEVPVKATSSTKKKK